MDKTVSGLNILGITGLTRKAREYRQPQWILTLKVMSNLLSGGGVGGGIWNCPSTPCCVAYGTASIVLVWGIVRHAPETASELNMGSRKPKRFFGRLEGSPSYME
jgi:hypothetical protein